MRTKQGDVGKAGAVQTRLAVGNPVCLRLEELHPRGRMEIPHGDVIQMDKEGIHIIIPVIESKYLEGRRVEILWEKGMNFYCLSSIITRCSQTEETMVLVDAHQTLRSIDKRRYVRLQRPIHIEFKPKGQRCLFTSAEGKDLSGGGVRFITKYPLSRCQQLEMLLEVPIFPYLDIPVAGEVVRIERLKGNNGVQAGICFIDMDHLGRKRLMKYIMDEQQPLENRQEEEKKDLRMWFCLN